MNEKIEIRAGTVIFATTDCPEAIEEARAYARASGFSQDDIRICKNEDMVIIRAKRRLTLDIKERA